MITRDNTQAKLNLSWTEIEKKYSPGSDPGIKEILALLFSQLSDLV